MLQRSYGAGPWPSVVWVATWSCVGSKLVDLAGSASGGEVRSSCNVGAAAPDSARRSWTAGSRLGSEGYYTARSCGVVARVRFVLSDVGRGGGPRAGVCFCGVCGLVSWGRRVIACLVFWPDFPYKQGNVWFLDSIFLINWVNMVILTFSSNDQ
jgi:hypothetical protein